MANVAGPLSRTMARPPRPAAEDRATIVSSSCKVMTSPSERRHVNSLLLGRGKGRVKRLPSPSPSLRGRGGRGRRRRRGSLFRGVLQELLPPLLEAARRHGRFRFALWAVSCGSALWLNYFFFLVGDQFLDEL